MAARALSTGASDVSIDENKLQAMATKHLRTWRLFLETLVLQLHLKFANSSFRRS